MKIRARGFEGYVLSMYANTEDTYHLRKGNKTDIISYDIELLVNTRGIKSIKMDRVTIDEISIVY